MTFRDYLEIFKDIVVSTAKGMAITWRVFWKVTSKGAITIQYPEVRDQIPLGPRGLLFNDVEDCISCKQCAAACPVDCIHIEADKKEASEAPDFTKGGVRKTLESSKYRSYIL